MIHSFSISFSIIILHPTMIATVLILPLLLNAASAFAPAAHFVAPSTPSVRSASSSLLAVNVNDDNSASSDTTGLDRRNALTRAAQLVVGGISLSTFTLPSPALADGTSKVVVAGATGQTGRRVLERLASSGNLDVIGGVRSVDKATASLSESSTVVRGAMVQKVASVDTSAVTLQHLDVVKDSVDELAKTLEGASRLVIATGFIPGNPLKMNAAAHEVDNVGTCKLVDAAKKAGVKKVR